MKRWTVVGGIALVGLLLGACSPPEERAEAARERVVAALQAADRPAALKAIRDLQSHAENTPEAASEIAGLLVQSGEAAQAAWVLEEALRRFPESDELRLALGRVALITANASLARSAVESVSPESDLHSQALLLLAQAELGLGNLDRGIDIL